jgi:hypothetical protein
MSVADLKDWLTGPFICLGDWSRCHNCRLGRVADWELVPIGRLDCVTDWPDCYQNAGPFRFVDLPDWVQLCVSRPVIMMTHHDEP